MCEGKNPICVGVTAVICIGLLLTVILVPLSLKKVAFDEVAIKYNKVSRSVGTEVLSEGLHNVGPAGQLIKFKTTQRDIILESINCLSKDAISVTLEVAVFFSIVRTDIRKIFDDFADEENHKQFVEDFSLQVIRDTAADFTTKQFYLQREQFQQELQAQLASAFQSGNVFATVDSVQVLNIDLPQTILDAMLQSTVAEQDIENALSERDTEIQAAQIKFALAQSEGELLLIAAERDVAVINQETDQAIIVETAKMSARVEAFANISAGLGQGGDFFVESYLKYLVAQSNRGNTIIGM